MSFFLGICALGRFVRFRFGVGYIVFAAKGLIDGFDLGVLKLEGHFLKSGLIEYEVDGLAFDNLVLQYVHVAAFFDLSANAPGGFAALVGNQGDFVIVIRVHGFDFFLLGDPFQDEMFLKGPGRGDSAVLA